jgi:TRAP-type mannitol/chloroaromatic compound transport system permease large subunit
LRGVAPATIKTTQIYQGVMPFIVIQLIIMAMIAYWPAIATWLPAKIS